MKSSTRSKIKSRSELVPVRALLRRQGKTVVFTNGCFDLLHGGHVHLLRWAKARGDVLIVALNSDVSVRRLSKGPGRPIFPLAERMEVLAAFEDVDYVTWFGEATPQKIVAALLPDILVKGGDWGEGEIVGRAEVEAAGGKVLRVPYLKGHSSTNIIETIGRSFGPAKPGRR